MVTDDQVLRARGFEDRAVRVMRTVRGKDGARPPDGPALPTLALHIRGPRAGGRRVFEIARRLAEVARETRTALYVNDRVDVALALPVAGVHLGARSLPPSEARRLLSTKGGAASEPPLRMPPPVSVGVSVTIPFTSRPRRAMLEGADFVFAGSLLPTASHEGSPGAGWKALGQGVRWCRPLPVVAIGGVGPEHVARSLDAGAHGVAALSGVWGADDPAEAALRYIEAMGAR